MQPAAVTPLMKRHRLAAAGNGKARRYPKATAEALTARRGTGASIATVNRHLTAVKAFFRWLVADRRTPDSPFTGGNRVGDPERDRRVEYATLTTAVIAAVIATACASDTTFRGLTGTDRAMLYLTAMYTAFRPVELFRLTPADFALAGPTPWVRLDGSRTKNGMPAEQSVPAAVAGLLGPFLAGRPSAARCGRAPGRGRRPT